MNLAITSIGRPCRIEYCLSLHSFVMPTFSMRLHLQRPWASLTCIKLSGALLEYKNHFLCFSYLYQPQLCPLPSSWPCILTFRDLRYKLLLITMLCKSKSTLIQNQTRRQSQSSLKRVMELNLQFGLSYQEAFSITTTYEQPSDLMASTWPVRFTNAKNIGMVAPILLWAVVRLA